MNNGFHGFPGSIKPPYKVYTALLTQTSTNPPVANVLENTIGNIVWEYLATGQYIGLLLGAFPSTKYFNPMPANGYDADVNNGGGGNPYSWYRFNDDKIVVVTTDGTLNNSPIEIRVYN